jgi:Holliday junction resolvasome RuvABC endonuclease subunit
VIAGIDYSTHSIDVVLLDDDLDEARWFRRRVDDRGKGAIAAARRVRDVMPARGAWDDEGVVAVGIEQPFSKGMDTIKALAMVKGALLACLPVDVPIYEIAPTTWKKQFAGHGGATKAEVRALAIPFFNLGILEDVGRRSLPTDVTDALGIAYAARQIHDEKTTTRREAA